MWVDHGAGPITKVLANFIWAFMKKIDKDNKVMMLSGPIILLINLIVWVMFLWIGWGFVFLSFPAGLVNTIGDFEVSIVDYFYYSGYVIFTLGSGELAPVSGSLKLLSAFTSGLGVVFLTLSVSYILSIIDGVVQERSIGRQISSLGSTPEEIVLNMWSGESFYNIDNILNNITVGIDDITFKERAYPLLHFYHARNKYNSLTYNVPILDDVLTILEYWVKGDFNFNLLSIRQLRSAITLYLDSYGDYGKDIFEFDDNYLSQIDLTKIRVFLYQKLLK